MADDDDNKEKAKHRRRAIKDDLKTAKVVTLYPATTTKFPGLGLRPNDAIFKGVPAGRWKEVDGAGALPDDCPFLPIGLDKDNHYIVDSDQQFRIIKTSEFGQKTTQSLCRAAPDFPHWAWPRVNKDGVVVGFRQEQAAADIMKACSDKGVIDPRNIVRGRGAWQRNDGSLIVHCGGQLWENGNMIALGEVGGMVYPRGATIMQPWPECLTGHEGPALDLLPLLKRWSWSRPKLDPYLVLGWIGAAMICGALPWRPMIYMSGDKATGKSTLQKLLRGLFGPLLVQSANTTAAGIYQRMEFDALPVAVDENEPSAERTKALLELARTASDDQLTMRGGAMHQGIQFYNRSIFLFSSINQPAFTDADRSRMAMLILERLPEGTERMVLPYDEELERLGRKVMRRMIDGAPRFATIYQDVCDMLAGCGHDGRGQQTFGVLLTCASLLVDADGEALDVALGDNATDWNVWADVLNARALLENEDMAENYRKCFTHLLTVPVDIWRSGAKKTVGAVLHEYQKEVEEFHHVQAAKNANRILEDVGLKLLKASAPEAVAKGEGFRVMQLAIAGNHSALAPIFKGTPWEGNWTAAMRQAPSDKRYAKTVRFGEAMCRATCFPLSFITQRDDDSHS